MSKKSKISAKVNPNTTNFDNCIFQFPFRLPTEYLVDLWHNQYMGIW